MRVIKLIALFLAAGILSVSAQTNIGTNVTAAVTPAKTNSPAASRTQGPIRIHSDGQMEFDVNTYWVTYHDNVRVSDPQMKLTCEWLTANLPKQSSGHITNMVAETNVVIDYTDDSGQKTHVTGDKAVYVFQVIGGKTNETITLTANPPNKPKVESSKGFMTGDTIVWDRVAGKIYMPDFSGEGSLGTNSPSGTNAAPNKNPLFP